MKKKIITIPSLLIGILGFSQTDIYFKYDEAGNQRYRGPDINGKQAQTQDLPMEAAMAVPQTTLSEEQFFSQIRLYPVPVERLLTIEWSELTNELITSVSLYQHSTIKWKFKEVNIPDLGRQLKIDMSGYYPGVYILHFDLIDGRTMSKSIIKN